MSAVSNEHREPLLQEIPWRDESISRIILGTAQLGMDYGIANRLGQPDQRGATAIIESAWRHGIRHFDTAQAYGASERVLGRALRDLGVSGQAHVASKLSAQLDPAHVSELEASIERTFESLGTDRLWCMMLHTASWLDGWERGLGDLLLRYRRSGRFQHLGVSLNSPTEAARCLAHPDMEVLQIACNAWDRRMTRLGVLETARTNGRLCCVRSIYLKGLLTLPVEEVAARLPIAREASTRWHGVAARYGVSPVELAVRFAMTLEQPLVVGAETPAQIADTVRIAHRGPLSHDIIDALGAALDPVVDDTILTPRRWEDLDGVVLTPGR